MFTYLNLNLQSYLLVLLFQNLKINVKYLVQVTLALNKMIKKKDQFKNSDIFFPHIEASKLAQKKFTQPPPDKNEKASREYLVKPNEHVIISKDEK